MEPYYRNEEFGIELWQGDCLSVLPLLAPGSVDSVVTDPPYGVRFKGRRRRTDADKETPYASFGDTEQEFQSIVIPVLRQCAELSRTMAVFGSIRHLTKYPQPADVGGVFSDSCVGLSPWGFTCFQPILYYGKCARRAGRIGGSWPTGFRSPTKVTVCSDHPCAKPVEWMDWLVNRASKPDWTVLDPFMGSGTTGVACVNTGRRFIGIELDEGYCRIAQERIEKAIASAKQPKQRELIA